MKRLCLILFTGLAFSGLSQEALTLEDAVMGQWGKFRPALLNGAQWKGDSDKIVYFGPRYGEIFEMAYSGGESSTLAKLDDVADALSIDLAHLFGTQFTNDGQLIVSAGNAYHYYDPVKQSGGRLLSYPEEAENLHLSPTNKLLAYTIENNLFIATKNDARVKVTSNSDKNIVSGQAIARSEFGITNGIFWSPSAKNLGFYQKDETKVANYPLLDITTTPGSLREIKYPMAGQPSENAKVGVYNVEKGEAIYLEVEGDKEQYLTNFGWGPNETYVYIAVVNRDQNHMQLQKYEAATGKFIKTLFEEKHDKWVEPENPVWFIPGNDDEFLWMSERDGFMHAYRYNTEGELINQVTKGNWVLLKILGVDRKGKAIIVHTTDESGMNTVIRSVDIKSGKTTTLSKVDGQHSPSLHKNGNFILDSYSNLTTPGVQQVLDVKGKKVSSLKIADNPYSEGQLAKTEFLELKAKNGTVMNGRIIKPVDFDESKKYPVLVYVYGGPHAQLVKNAWLGGASLWMHHLANKGFIVFTLDNRGSANRGFEFENVIHRQLGTIEIADQMTGVNYLKSLPYVDADRMAVHGWSFGGFMTTSLMLRTPGIFKAGVAGGPVTDWAYYEVMYGERYMDRPDQNEDGYKKAKLHNYAKDLQGDLLLIHGTEDDVVVMQHNLSLVKAFVDEGILVDFFPYPTHPHNVRGKDRVHLMDKVLTYILDKLEK